MDGKPDTSDKIGVYNPLKYDFNVNYDINGDRKPVSFLVPSMEIVYFDPVVGEHIKKHLVDAIMNERGLNHLFPKNRDDILAEISV